MGLSFSLANRDGVTSPDGRLEINLHLKRLHKAGIEAAVKDDLAMPPSTTRGVQSREATDRVRPTVPVKGAKKAEASNNA
jgi:hypothetical protein